MNKSYMYTEETVVVTTDTGILPPIDYVDNIEHILKLENEIEFLRKAYEADNKALQDKYEQCDYRKKDSLKVFGFIAGVSIVTAIASKLLFPDSVLSHAALVTGAAFAPTMSLVGLSFRPSKQDIRGYEEKVKFEKETIGFLEEEKGFLENNPSYSRLGNIREGLVVELDSTFTLKYYEDAIKLRYEFGYNPDKFIAWYNEGDLALRLRAAGVADEAVMEFMSYVERQLEEQVKLGKK